ncbi:transketolase, partial [Salmonella enterica]|nr:transketolase [Salmonella enterica]
NIARGGYVLRDNVNPRTGLPDAVIVATGSEVGLAVGAADQLAAEGIRVRVVSVPSTTVFDKQDAAYKASVLPAGVPRVAVEAGVTD